MSAIPPPPHKPLQWVGRALDELMKLPEPVRRRVGYDPRFAQAGAKPDHVRPLKGFKGSGVLEVVEDFDGSTDRAVYTVKLADAVHVLHCFQKKSKKGIETPARTIKLIQQRLSVAENMHKERSAKP